jgi:hypothetical protein
VNQPGLPFVNEDTDRRLYRMVFPYLPPSKNVYDGWLPLWKSGAKKKWMKAIAREVEVQNIPKVEKVGLAVRLMFKSRARRDPQNYAQCVWNWVPDGLVQAGVIPDDDEGRIEIGPNWGLSMMVGDRQETVVTIALEVPTWRS